MSESLIRELRANPEFAALCRSIREHKRPLKWKRGKTDAEWAYATGYGDAIDFVLNSLGYGNDGPDNG